MKLKLSKLFFTLLALPIIFAFQNCERANFTDANTKSLNVENLGTNSGSDTPTNTNEVDTPTADIDTNIEVVEESEDSEGPTVPVGQQDQESIPEVEVGGGRGRFVVQAYVSGYDIREDVSTSFVQQEVRGTLPCGMPASVYVQNCAASIPAVCSASLKQYIKNQYAKPINGEITVLHSCNVIEVLSY